MYFNVTRDPSAEADLLAVRDLLFDKYYDAVGNRIKDSLTYDLLTEVDTGATAATSPTCSSLGPPCSCRTRPALRSSQAGAVPERPAAGHRDPHRPPQEQRGGLQQVVVLGSHLRFGHSARPDRLRPQHQELRDDLQRGPGLPDRPWAGFTDDRDRMLIDRAWDDPDRPLEPATPQLRAGAVEHDSEWWVHAEADQTLAALDLGNAFAYRDQLARSAQSSSTCTSTSPSSPARETFASARARRAEATTHRKSFFGKNMLHAHEHALIMFLHGRRWRAARAPLLRLPSGPGADSGREAVLVRRSR